MLWSSRYFVRRIIYGISTAHSKSLLSTTNADFSQNIRRSLHNSLALIAVTGTAATVGYYGITRNTDCSNSLSFSDRLAPIYATIPRTTTHCDASQNIPKRKTRLNRKKTVVISQDYSDRESNLKRKKTVVKVAASLSRLDTSQQVSRLNNMKDEMLTRWELDEDGWMELPPRAWPEYQPNPQQLEEIRLEIEKIGCIDKILAKKEGKELDNKTEEVSLCMELLFNMATSLLFYQIDAQAGFALYERLAKLGHVDSMVACGIVLVEGLGIPPRESEGLAWLEKAMETQDDDTTPSLSSAQAMYELGVVYYTGIDEVVEEDAEKAFSLFQRAAKLDHTAALYMVADCLIEGEGTERDVAKAIPLFYKAAERGHRYSRQRIRELLANKGFRL